MNTPVSCIGLTSRHQRLLQIADAPTGVLRRKASDRPHGTRRRLGQPVLVVLNQQPPGPRVVRNHVEYGTALLGDELVR